MTRSAAAALALLLVAGCGGELTGPPVATTLTLSASALRFDAVGEEQVVTATVLDQHGAPMPDAAVTFSGTTSVASVAAVAATAGSPPSAMVRSLAGGASSITAAAGGATASATVTVDQLATSLTHGNPGRAGRVNELLAEPVAVVLRDRLGAAVAGRVVTFAVALGGGSIVTPSATTGADGVARIGWRLGTSTSAPQELVATAGALTARLAAVALAGPPAAVRVVAGASQSGPLNTALPVAPAVRVADGFDNPVAGTVVNFAVTAGGGSVAGASRTTDAAGTATVGAFVLGPQAGRNTLAATVSGASAVTVSIEATGTPTGTMGSVVLGGGNSQLAIAGTAVPVRPSVTVRDGAGQPRAGVVVTFSVARGGGAVAGASVETDPNGVATVPEWTLGSTAAPNALHATASDPNLPTAPVIFTAVGCTPNAAQGYSLSICFATDVSASQRAAFTSAAARWAAIITGDVPDIALSLNSVCGSGLSVNQTVDDVMILAAVQPIDGPGAVLGSAGPCIIRTGSFPLVGVMQFDVDDVGMLESRNQFDTVILHEMGHVLGIGTFWQSRGLIALPSTSTDTLDTHFTGARAIDAFNEIGGGTYTGGFKVPVENRGGPGTRNAHWRESVLNRELMTGFFNANVPNPLSALTIASLIDLGYVADISAADPFIVGASLQADASRSGEEGLRIQLWNDVYDGPVHAVGRDGRLVRIR